jgi:hypothetical protein
MIRAHIHAFKPPDSRLSLRKRHCGKFQRPPFTRAGAGMTNLPGPVLIKRIWLFPFMMVPFLQGRPMRKSGQAEGYSPPRECGIHPESLTSPVRSVRMPRAGPLAQVAEQVPFKHLVGRSSRPRLTGPADARGFCRSPQRKRNLDRKSFPRYNPHAVSGEVAQR